MLYAADRIREFLRTQSCPLPGDVDISVNGPPCQVSWLGCGGETRRPVESGPGPGRCCSSVESQIILYRTALNHATSGVNQRGDMLRHHLRSLLTAPLPDLFITQGLSGLNGDRRVDSECNTQFRVVMDAVRHVNHAS